jgi:hypothetical protein
MTVLFQDGWVTRTRAARTDAPCLDRFRVPRIWVPARAGNALRRGRILGIWTGRSPCGRPRSSGGLVPVGFTTFPGEIWAAPRSWVETVYPNLAYFNEAGKGGHFAVWEEPQLFSEELRAAFKPLR